MSFRAYFLLGLVVAGVSVFSIFLFLQRNIHPGTPPVSGLHDKGQSEEIISPHYYLYRVSRTLRGGLPPDPQHYQDLDERLATINCGQQAKSLDCYNEVLQPLVEKYLASSEFLWGFQQKVNELLGFASFPLPADRLEGLLDSPPVLYTYLEEYGIYPFRAIELSNSLNMLVSEMVNNDLPWSHFLTARDYRFFYFNSLNFIRGDSNTIRRSFEEEQYYERFLTSKPLQQNTWTAVSVESPDVAAGVLTTPRFQSRFYNSATNQNRKKAAALFEVALCQKLTPQVEIDEDHMQLETRIAQGNRSIGEDSAPGARSTAHGNKRGCRSCHKQLDPVAWSFRGSELTLFDKPSPGRLVFKKKDGSIFDEPVRGIGHLATKLVEQEEYIDCQARRFWQWYAGDDKPLSENTLDALKARLKEQQGIRGFLKDLVATEDFWLDDKAEDALTPDQSRERQVVAIIRRCNACHESVLGSPVLNRESVLNEHYYDVIESLGLSGDMLGEDRAMPPRKSRVSWDVTDEDLVLIKAWLRENRK